MLCQVPEVGGNGEFVPEGKLIAPSQPSPAMKKGQLNYTVYLIMQLPDILMQVPYLVVKQW